MSEHLGNELLPQLVDAVEEELDSGSPKVRTLRPLLAACTQMILGPGQDVVLTHSASRCAATVEPGGPPQVDSRGVGDGVRRSGHEHVLALHARRDRRGIWRSRSGAPAGRAGKSPLSLLVCMRSRPRLPKTPKASRSRSRRPRSASMRNVTALGGSRRAKRGACRRRSPLRFAAKSRRTRRRHRPAAATAPSHVPRLRLLDAALLQQLPRVRHSLGLAPSNKTPAP